MPQEDSLGLCLSEMELLGRLGAIVSPVGGSKDARRRLAQQRACVVKGQPPPTSGLQEAYVHRAALANSAKIALESEEQRLAVLMQLDASDPQADKSASWSQQESEVRKARFNLAEAQETKGLAELALHYDLAQGSGTIQNAQQLLLSSIHASSLTRNRNIQEGAKAMQQIRRAKTAIIAAREKEQQEEMERAKKAKQMQRPLSSPVLRMPALRFNWMCPGQTCPSQREMPSTAPARTNSEDEQSTRQRERWIQHVRESLQSNERREVKSGNSRRAKTPNLAYAK